MNENTLPFLRKIQELRCLNCGTQATNENDSECHRTCDCGGLTDCYEHP